MDEVGTLTALSGADKLKLSFQTARMRAVWKIPLDLLRTRTQNPFVRRQ
jgi:hypothetical protein